MLSPMTPKLSELSDGAWDRALDAFPRATAFHTARWLRATAPAMGYRLSLRGLMAEGRIVGLVPLATRERGPFRLLGYLPYPYVGPLAGSGRLPQLLHAMRRRGTVTSRIEFPPGAEVDAVALALAGYDVHEDETMIVPVAGRTEEDLWSSFHQDARSAVRRTQRAGVEVVDADEDMVCRVMPALQREVFTRNGVRPPYDETVFRSVWEAYRDTGEITFRAAVRDERVVGLQAAVLHDGTAFGWQSVTRPERGVSPSAVLYWAELLWCLENGVRRLDMVGTPTPGVARFKRQFGAVSERYLVAQAQSPAYRALTAARGRLTGRGQRVHHAQTV